MSGTRLRILMYHRVLARPGHGNPGLVSAFASAFDAQMRHVAKRYRVLGTDEVLEAIRDRRTLPARSVLITFDDAYRDFGEVAWPILRRYGLPATLFVPTAFPDASRDFWWDRLYRALAATRCARAGDDVCGTLDLRSPDSRHASLRRVQALVKTLPHASAMALVDRLCHQLGETARVPADVHTWEELRQLAAEGVTIGAHSRTHAALTRLPPDDAHAEIAGSRDDVRRELGTAPRVFAYPYGDHDERVARLVRAAGFEMAVTCRPGHNLLHSADPVRLSRSNVTPRSSGRMFRVRLLAAGATLDCWHHAWRNWRRKAPEPRSGPVAPTGGPRIAYIMSRFPKLSETFVLNEMRAVASTGVRVDVYPLLREQQSVVHPEAAAWVARARFHPFLSIPIVRANAHFVRTRPLRYLHAWTETLLGTLGSANFFFGALGILPKAVRFAYEMERDGVSHVHAHFATHPAVAALVIHRLTGVPFSFTAHGSDLHVDRRMLERKVAAASFAITISRFNKEVMVATCGERLRDRIHVIHCGVDPRDFAPAPVRSTARSLRIVCVASLEAVKGHRFLIDACRMLVDRQIEFECDLVGDGPLRADLAAHIAGLDLDGRVRLAGAQPRPMVARLLAQAHVAVLASHPTPDGKREGIPVALMEAMAAGLPVVATRISGIPELVEPEVTGVLVPSGDPAALADALARLAGDAGLRERLGAEGRRTITRAFNLESSARELLALIASAGGAQGWNTADRLASPAPSPSAVS